METPPFWPSPSFSLTEKVVVAVIVHTVVTVVVQEAVETELQLQSLGLQW